MALFTKTASVGAGTTVRVVPHIDSCHRPIAFMIIIIYTDFMCGHTSKWSIRVDDRMPTSCHRKSSMIDVLEAVRDKKDVSLGMLRGRNPISMPIENIDCAHPEARIRYLEDYDPVAGSQNLLQEILEEQYPSLIELPVRNGPSCLIFFAEADRCQSSLDGFPFCREARQPRKSEIYLMKPDGAFESKGLVDMVYLGSYSRSQAAIERDKIERKSRLEPPLAPAEKTSRLPERPHKRQRADDILVLMFGM